MGASTSRASPVKAKKRGGLVSKDGGELLGILHHLDPFEAKVAGDAGGGGHLRAFRCCFGKLASKLQLLQLEHC